MSVPLISCIMPTANRPAFAARAVRYFLAQDYPRKELIILDDTPGGPSLPGLESNEEVRYVYDAQKRSLGEKRNCAIELSRGEIILHWDDDDWMCSRRISLQVEGLLGTNCDVSGVDRMLFYDLRSRRTWLYSYPAQGRQWLAGGSFCYWNATWKRRKFKAMTRGEDTHFIWASPELRLHSLHDFTFYIALIHAGNTCVKSLGGPCWQVWNGPAFQELAGQDWQEYCMPLQGQPERRRHPVEAVV